MDDQGNEATEVGEILGGVLRHTPRRHARRHEAALDHATRPPASGEHPKLMPPVSGHVAINKPRPAIRPISQRPLKLRGRMVCHLKPNAPAPEQIERDGFAKRAINLRPAEGNLGRADESQIVIIRDAQNSPILTLVRHLFNPCVRLRPRLMKK